jgi:PAS domain S-box-containing protein
VAAAIVLASVLLALGGGWAGPARLALTAGLLLALALALALVAGRTASQSRRALARSHANLERRMRQQAAVAALGSRGMVTRDLDVLFSQAAGEVATAIGVDLGVVLERAGGAEVALRAAVGCGESMLGARLTASPQSPTGGVLASGRATAIEGAVADPLVDLGAVSAIIVPIAGEAAPWGALAACHRGTRTFSPDDLDFLQSVANLLASSITRLGTEKELRQAQQRLQHLLEHSPGVLFSFPVGTPTEASFVSENSPRIFGFSPEDLARPGFWRDHLHPDDLPIADEALARLMSVGTSSFEYRFRHADDGWRWLRNELSLVRDTAGVPLEVVGVTHDVSRQRQLEEELRQAQKMEAVGRLAGGVAHDFNNLLTAINGYSELLMLTLAEGDPSRHEVEEIHAAGERAASLTRQLLAFSRRQVLQPRVVDLNVVVGDTEKMLRRLIGEDVHLDAALSPGPLMVKVDPGQIEQVVLNLAVNARDAMPDGGRLTIRTGGLDVDGTDPHNGEPPPGSWVFLQLADTGSGMSEEVLERVFEPFFTTKEVGKGTGLGLSMVHGTVRQSGGCVEVESVVGVGSTFTVFLPRASAAVAAEIAAPSALKALGTETVLVVEDESAVRQMLVESLRSRGYDVLAAASAEEALALARDAGRRIDLLVSDVVMPDVRGPRLRELLLALRPQLRTLYISGYTDQDVDAVAEGIGVGFLQKPFTLTRLVNRVRELLDDPAAPN